MSFGLKQMQQEQGTWQEHNIGIVESSHILIGVQEELGELCHAHLKMVQGIRGNSNEHRAKAKDAIGDMLVYLAGYCNREGYDLESIVEETWAEVKQRDWRKYPKNGVSE